MEQQKVSKEEIIQLLTGVIFHLDPDGCADEQAFRSEAIALRDRLKAYGVEGA